MTSPPDLADFVLARITDREEVARRAAFGYGASWVSETDHAEDWSVVHADGERDMVGCEDGDVTQHIALNDPATVLARCAADRAIVELALGYRGEHTNAAGYERILRLLAAPHSTHPDYQEAWRV